VAVVPCAVSSTVFVPGGAGPAFPWAVGERDVADYASGLRNGVLDAGTAPDGDWRVVVSRDDGWCVKRVTATGQGGACQLSTPGQLDEASQFPTWDGDEYVVVVAGPAPPGTNTVELTAQGTTATATVTEVDGRLFWSARVPPGEGETRAVAYDVSGTVVDELYWPPTPPPATPPILPMSQLVPNCLTAVNAETGEESCARS
jgi:hypothetical protein